MDLNLSLTPETVYSLFLVQDGFHMQCLFSLCFGNSSPKRPHFYYFIVSVQYPLLVDIYEMETPRRTGLTSLEKASQT